MSSPHDLSAFDILLAYYQDNDRDYCRCGAHVEGLPCYLPESVGDTESDSDESDTLDDYRFNEGPLEDYDD